MNAAITFEHVQGQKYKWLVPTIDQSRILQVSTTYSLCVPVASTLVTRGIESSENIDSFLFGTYDELKYHPSLLKDANKAVDRIIRAIENGDKILVFGDYDVDGITSSALMMICLIPLGARVNYHVPHRARDGYGLSVKVVEKAAASGYKVLITVDNGITAFAPAQRALQLGIDLIITDHHRPHDHIPEAYAVIDPLQHDCLYPFKMLAGVGVSFKVLSLLYERLGKTLPAKAYELMLLGTVADVVPLIDENRLWVRHGLSYVNKVQSLSFATLKANGNVSKERVSSTDIGFCLAPQINALGRLEDPRQGVQFLMGSDPDVIVRTGQVLKELNQARKEIEKSIFSTIKGHIEQRIIDIENRNIVVASSDQWPTGVIGLVASRIVSLYHKPTILLHTTDYGISKGSCRSIGAVNMFDALSSAAHLIEQFGGHSQAAGLSIKTENVVALSDYLHEHISKNTVPSDFVARITIDAQAQLADFSQKMVHDLAYLEPFGHQNSVPTFYVKNVTLVSPPTLLKDAHVKCMIFDQGVIKPLIFFNRPEIYEKLLINQDKAFDVAVQITENHWNGRISIELIGVDIAWAIT